MILKMCVGRLFIDQVEFDLDPAATTGDRVRQIEMQAEALYQSWNRGLLYAPTMYVEAESKMNSAGFILPSWDEIRETTPGIKSEEFKIGDVLF